jgi:hypothetical protein
MNKKLTLSLIFGMIFLFGMVASVNAFDWDSGTVSYWKLDNSSGNAIDVADGNDGTVTGATQGVSGKIDNAYGFDGSGDYIALGNPANLQITGNLSISAWVNVSGYDGFVLAKDDGTNRDYRLLIGADGTVGFGIFISNAFKNAASDDPLLNDTWQHIVGVYNGTHVLIYINGTLAGTPISASGSIDNDIVNLFIGRRSDGASEFTGRIDEIAIFNRTLSSQDVQSLYNFGDGITYGEQPAEPLNVSTTLNLPVNYYNTSSSQVEFNSTATVTNGNFSNTTLYIWYSGNTSLFKTNFTIVSGNSTNNTNLSISSMPMGDYLWNQEFCATNSTGSSTCSFATSNRTFTINSISGTPTYNSTSYETSTETYTIEITPYNGQTPTSGKLNWNGTNQSAIITSLGNGNFSISSTKTIPLIALNHNISFNFSWVVDSTTEISQSSNQSLGNISLAYCFNTTTGLYINFSFKDEGNLSEINANIPTSTFNYWIGDGTVNKTLTYVNTTDAQYFGFCLTPGIPSIKVDSRIQYKSTDYPQRTYDPDVLTYTNTTTNKTLYLLGTADGIYVTFQVINLAEQTIIGVTVNATRTISGDTVIVGDGTTDASGSVTFWLNPDFQHLLTFAKTGYSTTQFSVTPTQTSYTVSLGQEIESNPDYNRGVTFSFSPNGSYINQNEEYVFGFTISSDLYNFDSFGFSLYYKNGTLVGSQTSTSSGGGTISLPSFNITNITRNFYMEANYTINGSTSYLTNKWVVQGSGVYGIWSFIQRAKNYIGANIFGINGDSGEDDLGKAILSFIILIGVAGTVSYRYGIQSEAAIFGIVFGLIGFLDFGLGLIPNPVNAVPHFISILLGILLIGFIVKEELR